MRQQLKRGRWMVAGLGVALLAAAPDARAADLQSPRVLPAPPAAPPAARVPLYPVYPADPGPASTFGYYGYYGSDIQGVPYYGLYSEDVTCLRSAATPEGDRVVNACRTR